MQKFIEGSIEWYEAIGNNIINSNLEPIDKWNKLYSLIYGMDEKNPFKEKSFEWIFLVKLKDLVVSPQTLKIF